jgi:hypothetical protein
MHLSFMSGLCQQMLGWDRGPTIIRLHAVKDRTELGQAVSTSGLPHRMG